MLVEDELNRTREAKSEVDHSLSNHEQEVNELRLQVTNLQQTLEEKEMIQSRKYVFYTIPYYRKLTFHLINAI